MPSGTSGDRLMLRSNFFELQMAPNYMLYQYSVDFAPDIQNKRFRIALLKDHVDLIGEVHAFDGMQLFLPKKLPDKVSLQIGDTCIVRISEVFLLFANIFQYKTDRSFC